MSNNVHENSLRNLDKGKRISEDNARIYQQKALTQRRKNSEMKKKFRDALNLVNEKTPPTKVVEFLKSRGIEDHNLSYAVAVILRLYESAISRGDVRAADLLLKISGENSIDIKHEISHGRTLDEWHAFIKDARGE